jgi:ABC-2 type transport system permease protein
MTSKLLAMLKKDWDEALSYRLAFLMQAGGVVAPVVAMYFLARVFDGVDVAGLARYGGNYVSFILIGIIVTSYSGTAAQAFSSGLRRAQLAGTLEVLLLTRASLPTIVVGWSLYPFLRSTVMALVYLAGGFAILGLALTNMDLPATFLVFALTVAIMASLGILAASFTLVFKQGDPFTMVLLMASGLLSGVAYPVSVLPEWLQAVAQVLPQTHAIEGMRLAVLQGYSVQEIAPQLALLGIYAGMLLPLSWWVFSCAIHRARADGSLAHY